MNHLSKRLQFKHQFSKELLKKCSALDDFKGFWRGQLNISPQILHRLKKFTLITSTGSSTRIEGSYLSDEEVKKLLSGLKIQKLNDRSKQEVAGYAELTQIIFDSYKNIDVSENSIKHLHNILLKYSEVDTHHRGKYKVGSNAVVARDSDGRESVIFRPTPPFLTGKEMQELVEWTHEALEESSFHPLLIIGNFVGEFLAIHPFQDGNGRLSRILTNLLLLKQGYSYTQYTSLEKIIEDNKESYYLALRKSQKNREQRKENLMPWLGFFLDCLIEQMNAAQKILNRENIENELSRHQITILETFRSSTGDWSVKELVEKTGIKRITIRKTLERLRTLNLVTLSGLGRASRWKIKKDKVEPHGK